MRYLLALITMLAFAVELEPEAQLQGPTEVVRVVDGGTVRIVFNGAEGSVRLTEIDAPEPVAPNTTL